jgi:hypothetical protein
MKLLPYEISTSAELQKGICVNSLHKMPNFMHLLLNFKAINLLDCIIFLYILFDLVECVGLAGTRDGVRGPHWHP